MRTDLEIVQYPPVPDFGGLLGMNKIQTDPDFGTKIVRLTDASNAGNRSMQTADAAQAVLWNKNDTLFIARDTGSREHLFQFNPATMKGKLAPVIMTGKSAFSRLEAHFLFSIVGTKLVKTTFSMASGTPVISGITTIADFSTILPTGFKVTWVSAFAHSADDTTFSLGFSDGVQNTAIYACVYQAGHGAGNGYRMLNTQTGMVTAKGWGQVGPIALKSSTTKVPFTLHEVYGTANRKYALLAALGSSAKLIWEIETLNVVSNEASGHDAHGMVGCYNGGMGGGQLQLTPYANPTAHSSILVASALPSSLGQHFQEDSHFEFGLSDPNDASIVWASCGGAFGAVHPFVSAWMNEIRGYDLVNKVVLRACHTFNSCTSPEFIVQNAIAVPSQTGKFVAFTSDMMKTLGATDGTPDGTLAGKVARGDVFIVAVA
jgi:hypothetical protein